MLPESSQRVNDAGQERARIKVGCIRSYPHPPICFLKRFSYFMNNDYAQELPLSAVPATFYFDKNVKGPVRITSNFREPLTL